MGEYNDGTPKSNRQKVIEACLNNWTGMCGCTAAQGEGLSVQMVHGVRGSIETGKWGEIVRWWWVGGRLHRPEERRHGDGLGKTGL